MATATQRKILGAFYTTHPVARFLVEWAIRKPEDAVLDPSCGDGVFLQAADQRLSSLGSNRPQIWGIDVNPEALQVSHIRSPETHLLERDFFSLKAGDIPPVSAIVGNPPFIRYQNFKGKQRADALGCAANAGVVLPQLCSSWAPFIVHASTFLRPGGRLGMVAPAELIHAGYAREVLRFLLRSFGRISVRMFQKKMFEELSEDTILLQCESFGETCGWFSITPATSIHDAGTDGEQSIPVNIEAIRCGKHRITRYLLSPRARHLYESLAAEGGISRLGDAADVGIGYVTGCNNYFHLTTHEAKALRVPGRYMVPAVFSLGDFQGTVFRRSDWKLLEESGRKAHLLRIPAVETEELPKGVAAYIAWGKEQRIAEHFKCRVREMWYSVPHVRVGDAFLSYMSGSSPKLVRNGSKFVAPNTLHIVRFARGWQWAPFVVGWVSSLTRLSCEIEGHALGGGMLKLEPSEAENVMIALPYPKDTRGLLKELDVVLRTKNFLAASDLADNAILRRRFGLSKVECLTLRDAARQLELWRMHK